MLITFNHLSISGIIGTPTLSHNIRIWQRKGRVIISPNARSCISYLINAAKSSSYPTINLETSVDLSYINMLSIIVRHNWKHTKSTKILGQNKASPSYSLIYPKSRGHSYAHLKFGWQSTMINPTYTFYNQYPSSCIFLTEIKTCVHTLK